MTNNEITHITIITTILIIVVFLFSYLQSHREQNTSSLPFICSPTFGKTTLSHLHCIGGTFIIYVRRSMDDCVVFVTEERLGQIHLHLLSSYCASDRCNRQTITMIATGKMYFNIVLFSLVKKKEETCRPLV